MLNEPIPIPTLSLYNVEKKAGQVRAPFIKKVHPKNYFIVDA